MKSTNNLIISSYMFIQKILHIQKDLKIFIFIILMFYQFKKNTGKVLEIVWNILNLYKIFFLSI